jgi:hypothetical protein
MNPKNRPRPPIDPKDKDEIKYIYIDLSIEKKENYFRLSSKFKKPLLQRIKK